MILRHSTLVVAALIALFTLACNRAAPTNVAAEVNGRPITNDDLEKQYKLQFPTPPGEVNDEQVQAQKMEILRVMIDNEIMLQRAEKQNLVALDSEVEKKFVEVKTPYTQEDFQKQLDSRKITVEELKKQFRRDLSIEKLMNKEISSHVSITDADVTNFYNKNKANFNLASPQVHLAQILVTPGPDSEVQNLRSDNAQTEAQAVQKIENIMARLKQGEDFAMIAQSFSEDPESAPNGGDMGFVAESALEQAHVELRKMITSMKPGQVSPPVRTPEGFRIFKLITKEPAGQRELSDPRVQQSIRDRLVGTKEQLLRNAFYEICRNEAKVTNYYANAIYQKFTGTSQ